MLELALHLCVEPYSLKPNLQSRMSDQSDTPRRPNLFILGAQKAGTSWLHEMLSRHPDIYMSDLKELAFFNGSGDRYRKNSVDQYLANFKNANAARYVGESTPAYFWTNKKHPHAVARRVKEFCGADVRFLISLRNPVERAISAYSHHAIRGNLASSTSIFEAPANMGLLSIGDYSRHIKAWADIFDRNLFFVFRYEEIKKSPNSFAFEICKWLGVSTAAAETMAPPQSIHASAEVAKRHGLSIPPRPPEDDIPRLYAHYNAELERLESLLNWDLKHWKSP